MNCNRILLFCMAIAIGLGPLRAQTFSGGDGTQESPYLISNVSDLRDMATYVMSSTNQYYRLVNDINMQGQVFTPIGTTSTRAFRGHFDGNGNTISNLSISGTNQYYGLFGYMITGTIENLNLENCSVTASGKNNVGGVCGYAVTNSVIRNVSFHGNVRAGTYSGIICGTAKTTIIERCVASGSLTVNMYGGGICGQANGGSSIINCCNLAAVNGGTSGGICGTLSLANDSKVSEIICCSNFGTLNGSNCGGLVGIANKNASFDNCFNSCRSNNSVGAIVYKLNSTAVSFQDLYYDFQICTNINNTNNYGTPQKKNTLELVSGHFFNDTVNWSEAPGRYPIPKGLEDKPLAQLAAAAAILSSYDPTNVDVVTSVKRPVVLSKLNGVTWTLVGNGNSMAMVEDGSIVYPTAAGGADYITAHLGVFEKQIFLNPGGVVYSPTFVDGLNSWAPDYYSNVIIIGDAELNNDQTEYTVNDLYIANNASLTIPDETKLNVYGNLINFDPDKLVIHDGELEQYNKYVRATYLKDVAAFEPEATTCNGWMFLAPAIVDNLTTSGIDGLIGEGSDLYQYDELSSYWCNEKCQTDFNELVNGRGYLYANQDDVTLVFAGEIMPTNATCTIPLNYHYDNDLPGFNLVGNPFTNSITTFGYNGDINGIYVMNDAGNELTATTLDDLAVGPCQGFFVKASYGNVEITFNSASKSATQPEMLKTSSVSLTLSCDGNIVDRAYLLGEGERLEKVSLNEANTNIFFTSNDEDYAIASCDSEAGVMQLNIRNANEASYTLNINVTNSDYSYLHLLDNLTGADVDMLVSGNTLYSFEAKASDSPSRFTLVYRK